MRIMSAMWAMMHPHIFHNAQYRNANFAELTKPRRASDTANSCGVVTTMAPLPEFVARLLTECRRCRAACPRLNNLNFPNGSRVITALMRVSPLARAQTIGWSSPTIKPMDISAMPCDMTVQCPRCRRLRTAVNTQHDRQRRTVNIRIQYADSAAFLRQRQAILARWWICRPRLLPMPPQ